MRPALDEAVADDALQDAIAEPDDVVKRARAVPYFEIFDCIKVVAKTDWLKVFLELSRAGVYTPCIADALDRSSAHIKRLRAGLEPTYDEGAKLLTLHTKFCGEK